MGKPQGMDTVWWAILGLTTQYISEQIDEEGYQLVVNSISDTVAQLNDSSVPGSGNNSGNGEQIAVDLSTSSKLIMNSKQPTCSIQPSEEFRFFMLRHWSLENSMQYSSFIVSRLGTWSARGKSVFRLVIAKLGLAISEIQQSYTHLDPKLKSELPVRWDRVSSDYNLENAMFNSFVRTYGWKMPPISAADHVCVSNALLIDSTVVADWKVAFYKAYDCLANLNVLHTGLSCALKTQQSLVDLACSMLDQKLVKTLSKFRLAVINLPFSSTSTSSLLSSESHLMLIQLGNLLIDALRNHGNPAHAKLPFILAYYDPQSLAYTVFGLTPPEYHASAQLPPSTSTYSGDLRNKFGLIFELSATDCGAEITNSYFDTCIVSITESKFKTFIDKLRKHL
ncbi:Cell division control protein 45-like protein [Zancudomyces culisetae]|uniref:Cell division control protein 45-like protein n=1 Tax=Zancudomyces culisetae TaxID=1213189 RepID=A0A1R1PUB0_ZANCU|nr:Cell division control protein 45-like protein [Zancudomyces culisetae]|eukprot:OMH84482.1 Cell division control protein 45-like protein [Zancudomyces culisetae]